MERLDTIINCYKDCPEIFDDNVWKCYSACKKEIVKMQGDGLVGTDGKSYAECIEYVSKKLGI